ncbi:MAG: hypothetical protein HQK71_10500 [Desulfamplus sp.]|nr:hypothetical protein [Desulfamplus sp.]
MKIRKTRLQFLLFVFAFFTIFGFMGCGEEDEKDDYSTVSNMISDRNKARFDKAAQDSAKKAAVENQTSASEESTSQTDVSKLPGLVFEENIKIVSESSGRTIATGIAYLDKSGKIVNIRVKK